MTASATPRPTVQTSTNSFIGNTPSTVLFFIALAVGVCIALLFVYFTLRYFVKTKFGIYIPNQNNLDAGGGALRRGQQGRYLFTNGISTFNNFSDFSDYAFNRDYNILLAARERSIQRLRYRKKRKMTKEEVDSLFPMKSYHDWLNGGKEDDLRRQKGLIMHENELEENNLEADIEEGVQPVQTTENAAHLKGNEIVESTTVSSSQEADITEMALESSTSRGIVETVPELEADSSRDKEVDLAYPEDDLHFSSGTCAICLDSLDDEDIVRGLICGHVFHLDCIDPWLINRKACCPMCKRDYYMKDLNNVDDNDNDSLVPMDSFPEYLLPRPIAFRARELLDVLEAYTPPNNNTSETPTNSDTGVSATAGDSTTARDAGSHDPHLLINNNANAGRIDIQDLLGIKELADERFPSYYNFFQRIFWRIMGITRENLYDYLIVKIYETRRLERIHREQEAEAQRGANNLEEIELTTNANNQSTDNQGTNNQATTIPQSTTEISATTRQLAERMV